MDPIRVLLADDHTIVRKGLRLLLERESDMVIVGEAATGREAIAAAERYDPQVIVMDIGMPIMNGIEATRRIIEQNPDRAIVILSVHSDEAYILRALKAGARAYLRKDSAETDLAQAVRSVASGKAFFSPAVSKVLAEDYLRQVQRHNVDDPYELLTSRERDLLQLIAELRATKEIAEMFGVSVHTVDTHRSHLMQKLSMHSIPELILYAVRRGIIS